MIFPRKVPKDSSEEAQTFKYFNIAYAIALTLILLISIFSQALIQRYLSNQIDDSHVLNFAARLRTYNQTLSKLALLIESGRDIETNRKEFLNTLKQWQKSHQGLVSGSDFLNLPGSDIDDMDQMFDIIQVPFNEIVEASNGMLGELYSTRPLDSLNLDPYISKILENEKSYLLGMELIVFDYDRFSRNAVKKLKDIEYLLLGFVFLTLVLEAAFIFSPLAKRIKRIIKGLKSEERNAKSLADQLSAANQTLEASHRELREINFALEKATYLVKTDDNGLILYANDKYCHITKYSMSGLLGKQLFYNNMGGEENVIYHHIKDPRRKKEVWQGEIFDHASDGTGFWLDVTLMPIIDKNAQVYQYMVICTDITQRKKTERELRLLLEERIRRQEAEQKIKSYSIINGQEKERKRVAAEIHDGIGQMLTSLRIKIEMMENGHPQLQKDISQITEQLKSIIHETRRICSDLLPSVLEDFGLSAAIKELIRINADSNISIVFEDNIYAEGLDKEIETGIYRIVQEAINNAIKHSNGDQVFLHVDNDAEYVNVIIEDNGVGFIFDENKLFSSEYTGKANGLRNMHERAELLGGMLNITSEQGKGTIIQVEIPL